MQNMVNSFEPANPPEPNTCAGVREDVEGLSGSLFEILWRRHWTVFLVAVLAVLAGVLYLQHATPLYESTSRIYVEQTGPQVFERDTGGMVTRWDNYLYTQAERLKSSEILSAALRSPGMADLKTFTGISNPMAELRREMEVTVGKKDEIINISIMSPYPDEAAHIINTVVDAYLSAHEQRKRNTVGEVVRILKEEKTKRSSELIAKLQRMMEFRQTNEGLAFGTDQDSNIIVRRLERLSTALTEAQLAAIECKSFYEAAEKMAEEPSGLRQLVEAQRARGIYISTVSEADSLRAELKRLERDRADSLHELKPDHPAILALDAEIVRVNKQLTELDAEFARGQLAVAEQQYLTAREKERELQRCFEEQRQEAILLNNQLAQYTILQSDYEQTKKLCDLLDNSIQRLDVATEVGALDIGILEAAEPALEPSEPRKTRTMALALGLGVFAGMGLAVLRESRDQRLRSTEEISALLGLPALGVIPSMTSPRQTLQIRGQKVRISPESREAEAFRTVRTALFFGASRDKARTIVITSPAPGEGKSTVVSNLGIAIAQAGQRVLIVDADLRRPMQHRIFSLDRQTKGLSSVLLGEVTLDRAIEHTGLENLDILTCGPGVPNPSEVLNSDAFAEFIAEAAGQYDRVLIDSPPVVAVSDSQILAALCDAAVLVLRAEQSTRRLSMHARDSLVSVEAKLLGVVVNDVPRNGSRYGCYDGYGRYYHSYGGNGSAASSRRSPGKKGTPSEVASDRMRHAAPKTTKTIADVERA